MKKSFGLLIKEKTPFFVLSAVFCLVAVLSQQHGGATVSLSKMSMATRCSNAVVVFGQYVWKSVWPHDLVIWYPHPGDTIRSSSVAGSLLFLTLTTVAAAAARSRPYLLIGWLWYLGTLIPVSGLVQLGHLASADRYTYLPKIGLLIAATWFVASLVPSRSTRRILLPGSAAAIVVAFVVVSYVQVSRWRNSVTLFRYVVSVNNDNAVGHTQLGMALAEKRALDAAIFHFHQALRISPSMITARYDLGRALAETGQFEDAIHQFRLVLDLAPNHADAYNNLGVALRTVDRSEEAIPNLQQALRIRPDFAIAHFNLALALIDCGRTDEANHHFEEAIRLNPAFANHRLNFQSKLNPETE